MSHTSKRPEEYVCEDCHSVYAGTPYRENDTIHYDPPSACAACGGEAFVEIERFPLVDRHVRDRGEGE